MRLKHGQKPGPPEFGMISNAGGFQEPLDIQNKKTKGHCILIFIESGHTCKLFGWNFMFERFLVGDAERIIKSYALLKF